MAALIAFSVIPKAEPFETAVKDLTHDHGLVML
jgi:hypothetical protein